MSSRTFYAAVKDRENRIVEVYGFNYKWDAEWFARDPDRITLSSKHPAARYARRVRYEEPYGSWFPHRSGDWKVPILSNRVIEA